ncbi:MAG: UbiA-like polyprenyltransferase [Archaeoglobaceae archaeon]
MKLRMYLDFIKIEHTLFALPFAYIGAIMAAPISLGTAFLIFTAFTGLRTAAMTFNRIIDAEIDAKNPRTANRHIPRGLISVREAYSIAAVALAVYFASAFLLNRTAAILSPIPPIVAYVYPYLKRFTCLCHYVLGLNLALAPLGGFVAATDSIDFLGRGLEVTLIAAGVVFWVAGFDMIYALQDVEFDRREGLHSLPAHFGEGFALLAAKLNHVAFLALVSMILKLAALPVALLLVLEHAIVHLKPEKLEYAFYHVNAAISVTLLASVIQHSGVLPCT